MDLLALFLLGAGTICAVIKCDDFDLSDFGILEIMIIICFVAQFGWLTLIQDTKDIIIYNHKVFILNDNMYFDKAVNVEKHLEYKPGSILSRNIYYKIDNSNDKK